MKYMRLFDYCIAGFSEEHKFVRKDATRYGKQLVPANVVLICLKQTVAMSSTILSRAANEA